MGGDLVEGSGEVRHFLLAVVVRVLPPVNLELEPARSVTNSGRGTTRAEDSQGTPTQSHISPSILVYEDYNSLPEAELYVISRGPFPS